MPPESVRAGQKPRLSPFVFSSETGFRFALLVVAVLSASLFIFNWLLTFDTDVVRTSVRGMVECWEAHPLSAGDGDSAAAAFMARSRIHDARRACSDPYERYQGILCIGGLLLLIVVIGAIYWLLPVLTIRRKQFMKLKPEDDPELVAYLGELCREAGLSRCPEFLLDPLNGSSTAVTFGRLGQYYIVLNGGLVMKFRREPSLFRAVVLHELAHIRNKDVHKAYLAVATWYGFVVVGLIPFLLSAARALIRGALDLGLLFGVSWRILAMIAFVLLTRNSVLRVRETYADVRASSSNGATDALIRVLTSLPAASGGRLRALLRVHPSPAERRRALVETHGMFQLGFWGAVSTGVAATIGFSSLTFVLILVLPPISERWVLPSASLLFCMLAGGAVGLGVWRNSFAAWMRGEAPRGWARLAVGLGLGLTLGMSISFHAVLEGSSRLILTESGLGTSLPVYALWGGVVLLPGLLLFLKWIATSASAWLETATTPRSLRRIYRLGLLVAGAVLAVWFSPAVMVLNGMLASTSPLAPGIAGYILLGITSLLPEFIRTTSGSSAVVLLVLFLLWAFPLGAWLRRGRLLNASALGWAYLDSASPLAPRLLHPPLRPRLALALGFVGGVMLCALLLAFEIQYRHAGGVVSEQGRLNVLSLYLTWGAYMQAVVALVAATWIKRSGAIHGFCAAFCGGCVMAVVMLGSNIAFGGTIDLELAWNIFYQMLSTGAELAFPIAIGASLVAQGIRRLGKKIRPGVVESVG